MRNKLNIELLNNNKEKIDNLTEYGKGNVFIAKDGSEWATMEDVRRVNEELEKLEKTQEENEETEVIFEETSHKHRR